MRIEIEDRDRDEAKKRAARERSRLELMARFKSFYKEMRENCDEGQQGKCDLSPALICIKSLNNYPRLHCWLSKNGFFPFLADRDFLKAVKTGGNVSDNAFEDTKPIENWLEKLRMLLKCQ
jgi:hypothetical protein